MQEAHTYITQHRLTQPKPSPHTQPPSRERDVVMFEALCLFLCFRWFFKNLSRNDAMRLLLAPGNTQGSFMVRESETAQGSFSLSVRDLDPNTGDTVKHYRIRNLDTGGFYITAKISFNSLKELVQHHSRTCYDSHPVWTPGAMPPVRTQYISQTIQKALVPNTIIIPSIVHIHLSTVFLKNVNCITWRYSTFNPASVVCVCRWGGRSVHPADEAVPVPHAPETLVAGRMGDPPRVPQDGAQARGRAVWGSLDGWVNEMLYFLLHKFSLTPKGTRYILNA